MTFWLIFTGALIIRMMIKTSGILVTVGHVPRSISGVCWYFIQHGGEINRTRRQLDLPQGGLEVPCEYNFIGILK